MNNTYNKISKNADTEWKYSKSFYLMSFLTPKATLPPPLNIFYYFARSVFLFKNECKAKKLNMLSDEKRRKYILLLDRLIKLKMHLEHEDSVEDDLNDLRTDVKI